METKKCYKLLKQSIISKIILGVSLSKTRKIFIRKKYL